MQLGLLGVKQEVLQVRSDACIKLAVRWVVTASDGALCFH